MSKSSMTRILPILALSAGPVFAGAIYVPILPNSQGNATFSTQLVVGNSATAKRTYTSYFIAENSNGFTRTVDPLQTEVPAGDSISATVPATVGLLEIGGVPDILVYGTMVGTTGQGEVVGFPLPMITSSNANGPSTKQHLLGLVKNSQLFTNMYVVNLGQANATCSVTILNDKGQTLIATSTLTFKPLSMRQFPDALQLATTAVDGARAEVSCNQDFYSFATVNSVPGATGEPVAAMVIPAGTGASSLQIPGDESVNCEGTTAAHCYFLPGLVFAPVKPNNQKDIKFNVNAGSYDRVHFSMDVFYSGSNSRYPSGLHQFFWMAINGKNPDMIGFGSTNKGNKELMLRTGIGVPHAGKSKITKAFSLTPGTTYTIDYLYDTRAKDVVWNIIDKATGNLVVSLFDTPNVNHINLANNGFIQVDLSMSGGNLPDEPPSWGWKYYDLLFEIFD